MPSPNMSRPWTERRCLPAVLILLAILVLPLSGRAEPAVQAVGQVDLGRYVGLWYEIANFPMFFQRNCIADTTAEYSLRDDAAIAVVNRCRTADGFITAEGKATVVPDAGNGKLRVSFFWPFSSDYWIIGLDPDYRWALVGNPNRKYLWLLSRTPHLAAAETDKALEIARRQGFDLSKLRTTQQDLQ